MNMVIRSPPRTSTSGRAPVFSITMRFCIKVDSLNRPPTLLTMPSSFKSSSMVLPLHQTLDDRAELGHPRVEIVVNHRIVVFSCMFQHAPGCRQSSLGSGFVLRRPPPEPFLVGAQ